MKSTTFARYSITLLFVVSLISPVLAVGSPDKSDHKKHFKEGVKHEDAEQWDKAAESFALAVVENPKNPEYRLHLRRALFNASQMYMAKGRLAAEQKDYQAAFIAYRKAFAYDPVNELAKSEMERMVRNQEELRNGDKTDKTNTVNGVKVIPTSLNSGVQQPLPQKLEKLRNVLFPTGGDLQSIIKELANDLDLNVLFDSETFRQGQPRRMSIELRNVTSAKALDYIFIQENLFFQKVGPRTVLVANATRRPFFQQLMLKTFYLANANPKEVAAIVKAAIPAQPGRQTTVLEDGSTNSITVRDTSENIALISRLIQSLDKDRAEVVMDVAIYEVNKTDLLEFGNQIGSTGATGSLTNLGGVSFPAISAGPAGSILGGLPFIPSSAMALAIGLPTSQIRALQDKSNTKLIASTQIHAFNNEDSSARIGQRVPVKTATFQTGGTNNNGVVSDVINYEQVGLTLKFKPIVFPNQDVQVAMEIESKDVVGASLTPTFTERTIKGTARIQNNKTLLLVSVASGTETRGTRGLPILGLIPIIGRLFSVATRDDRKVDIVIAVTPRIIRAPAIFPEDEAERPTGSQSTPTSGSLEAMIIQEERDDLLAAARKIPNSTEIQLPDQKVEVPQYVRSDATATNTPANPVLTENKAVVNSPEVNLKPIDTSVRSLEVTQTADTSSRKDAPANANTDNGRASAATSLVSFGATPAAVKAGEVIRVPVMVDASTNFRSALLGMNYDPTKFSVRSIAYGGVFGQQSEGKLVIPFLNQNGKTYVTLALPDGETYASRGTLAVVEVEALADGPFEMSVDKDVLNFLTADGKNFAIRLK